MPCNHPSFESRVKVSDVDAPAGLYALEVGARCTACKAFLVFPWAPPPMPGLPQNMSVSLGGTFLRVMANLPVGGATDEDGDWHPVPIPSLPLPPVESEPPEESQETTPIPNDEGGKG